MRGGDVKEPVIDVDDIADAAVVALMEEGQSGTLYELTGSRLMAFADMTDLPRRTIGRQIQHLPIKFDSFQAAIAQGGGPSVADVFSRIAKETLDGRNSNLSDGFQRALGRPARDFGDFAKAANGAGAWRVNVTSR